jgi:hypothetical protein
MMVATTIANINSDTTQPPAAETGKTVLEIYVKHDDMFTHMYSIAPCSTEGSTYWNPDSIATNKMRTADIAQHIEALGEIFLPHVREILFDSLYGLTHDSIDGTKVAMDDLSRNIVNEVSYRFYSHDRTASLPEAQQTEAMRELPPRVGMVKFRPGIPRSYYEGTRDGSESQNTA